MRRHCYWYAGAAATVLFSVCGCTVAVPTSSPSTVFVTPDVTTVQPQEPSIPTETITVAPPPTVTITQQPPPPPVVTVTANPVWPPGRWSSGSPCSIPYPGLELGIEYGYTNDPTIKSWVFGVQELLQRLYDRGWTSTPPGPLDGEYGAKTEAGVIGFQSTYGIPVVGRVGPTTWATLRNQCGRFL